MEDPVEQITAPVEATPAPTKKDPEKVAAGKALARKSKVAREAKLKLDGRQQVEEQSPTSSLFNTFQNASILVGSALVLYHGYQAYDAAFGKKVEPSRPEPVKRPPVKEENSILMEWAY